MNVTALLATDGTPLERYVYDPYGKVTIYDDDWSDTRGTSSYDNIILFAGYYRDNETGLYHVRNRYYHPQLGWITRDPAGYADGMSLYEYCASGPLGLLDPFGLISRESAKEIQRLASDYNFAEKARRESERAAAIAESTAERLEKGAKAAERLGNLAEKKRLRGAAEKLREAAKECRQRAAEASKLAEDIAWQGKIAIEKAEWAERGTTGGGGDAYSWKKGLKDYEEAWNEKWYEMPWYMGEDLYTDGGGGSSVLDYISHGLQLAGLMPGPSNPFNPLDKAFNDLVQGALRPENSFWIVQGMALGTCMETPGIPVPGGLKWRGSGLPESGKGSWYNPITKESFHPDMTHPLPKGPHWDYTFIGPNGVKQTVPLFPDVPYTGP